MSSNVRTIHPHDSSSFATSERYASEKVTPDNNGIGSIHLGCDARTEWGIGTLALGIDIP